MSWATENPEKMAAYNKRYKAEKAPAIRIAKAAYDHRRHLKEPYRRLVDLARQRARKKNLNFDLTLEWAQRNWTGRCALTGVEFEILSKGRPCQFSPSIDRIDQRLGYIQGNCRFVLFSINAMKQDGTDETMMLIARELLNNQYREAISWAA